VSVSNVARNLNGPPPLGECPLQVKNKSREKVSSTPRPTPVTLIVLRSALSSRALRNDVE